VGVNADFKKFGIHSVDVHLEYDQGGVHTVSNPDLHFTSPDQRETFRTSIANDYWKFKYGYKVHYVDDSVPLDSGLIETDRTALTIDVGDLGVLYVEVNAGSIEWERVSQAEVVLQYEDAASSVKLTEARCILTQANPTYVWQRVIHAQRTKPYRYHVHYTLKDGREFDTDFQSASSTQLYVDDPFFTKAIHLRGLGDFNSQIDTVFLDLKWTDAANKYEVSNSIALTKSQPFLEWTFLAISGSKGQVTYGGKIKMQNGSTVVVPSTVATSDTIFVSPEEIGSWLDVNIEPALIDWAKVKLVIVELRYGGATDQTPTKSIAVKNGAKLDSPAWHLGIKDKANLNFDWCATFYFVDGNQKKIDWATRNDGMIVLETPAV
jgi:hypothetical protein